MSRNRTMSDGNFGSFVGGSRINAAFLPKTYQTNLDESFSSFVRVKLSHTRFTFRFRKAKTHVTLRPLSDD